jgi:hypothetical protein
MQVHDDRVFNWDTQSMFSLIVHPDWFPSVQVLRKRIVEALVEQDEIDVKSAQEIVDRELWKHIMDVLTWQYAKRYSDQGSSEAIKKNNNSASVLREKQSLKRVLGKIPGFVPLKQLIVQGLKNLWFQQKATPERSTDANSLSSLNLSSLLDPSSPFNADFMPVYSAISGPQE